MMSGGRGGRGGEGREGQKVLSKPSADSFAVGRRQKAKKYEIVVAKLRHYRIISAASNVSKIISNGQNVKNQYL